MAYSMGALASELAGLGASASATTTVPSPANDLFGGTTNLLQWLVLAFAGALVVGNLLALVRAPAGGDAGVRPARNRSLVMITIGMIVVIWAATSLLTS